MLKMVSPGEPLAHRSTLVLPGGVLLAIEPRRTRSGGLARPMPDCGWHHKHQVVAPGSAGPGIELAALVLPAARPSRHFVQFLLSPTNASENAMVLEVPSVTFWIPYAAWLAKIPFAVVAQGAIVVPMLPK